MTQAVTQTICRECCSSTFDQFGNILQVLGVDTHVDFFDEACKVGCGSAASCNIFLEETFSDCHVGVDFKADAVTFNFNNRSDSKNPNIVPQVFCGLDGNINLVSFSPTKAPVPTNEPTEFPSAGGSEAPTVSDDSSTSPSFFDGPGLIGVIVVGIVVVLGAVIVAIIVMRAPKKPSKGEPSFMTSPSGVRKPRIAETPEPPPENDPFPNRSNNSVAPSGVDRSPRYAVNDVSMDHLDARSTAASIFLPPAPRGVAGTRLDAASIIARDKLKNKKHSQKDEDNIMYLAEFDFEPEYPDELKVKKGEILIGMGPIDSEWWMIKNANGDEGMVPVSYLSKLASTNHKMSLPYSL